MKRLFLAAAAMAALTACNQDAADSDNTALAAANDTAAETQNSAATDRMTANGTTPGTFEVTAADGTKGKTVLNADGTYTDSDASGKETAQGAWSVTDGKTCFDPEGDEGPTCWTETAPAADGSFTATSDKGEVVTVKRSG